MSDSKPAICESGSETKAFRSFREFYPYYLGEHADHRTRRLHVIGTAGVLALLIYALATGTWLALLGVPVVGYGFSWAGHFIVERNKPAAFRHPFYSLLGDFRMLADIVTGRLPW